MTGRRRARLRQARPLRRRRRHLRADRHRRAGPAVRDAQRCPRAARRCGVDGGRTAPAPGRRPRRPGSADASAARSRRAALDRDARPRRRRPRRRSPRADAPSRCRRRRPTAPAPTPRRPRRRRRAGRAPPPRRPRPHRPRPAIVADDAARSPGALHRDPAEGVAREDHGRRDRLLQAGMQMIALLARACHRSPAATAALLARGLLRSRWPRALPPSRRPSRRPPPTRPTAWSRRPASCRRSWPGSSRQLAKPDPKRPSGASSIDPMLDTITGQQTETTLLFERRVTQRIGNLYPQFEFLPFQAANLARAQLDDESGCLRSWVRAQVELRVGDEKDALEEVVEVRLELRGHLRELRRPAPVLPAGDPPPQARSSLDWCWHRAGRPC